MHVGADRRDAGRARRKLIGFQVGVRESTQNWHELLIEAKAGD
jgi:hypothetical protein